MQTHPDTPPGVLAMASPMLFDATLSYGIHGEVLGPPPGLFGCHQPQCAQELLSILQSESASCSHHKAFNTEETIPKIMLGAFTQLLPYVGADIAVFAFSLLLQNLCLVADSELQAKREFQQFDIGR
eukprot:12408518-Karenia_brevis.AAC.1